MLQGVSKGKIKKPVFILLYARDGIGKSTFGSEAPNPIFLGPEDGTSHLDVARFEQIRTFTDVKNAASKVLKEKHHYETLVIDSLDHIEPILFKETIDLQRPKNSDETWTIEDTYGSFGKWVNGISGEWFSLIDILKDIRNIRKMNVIVLAHAQVKSINEPTQPMPYDRYALKLHNEKHSALWRESVECVLFVNYETIVKKGKNESKAKAYGEGRRVMYTEPKPQYDAKNRYGLPPELPFDLGSSWSTFYAAYQAGQPDVIDSKKVMDEITFILTRVDMDTSDRIKAALQKSEGDLNKLVKIRDHAVLLAGEHS